MPYLKYRHIDIVLQTFKFVNIFFIQILQLFLSNFLVFSHSGIKSLQLDFLNLDSWLRSPTTDMAAMRSEPIAASLSITTVCTTMAPPRLPLVKFIWNLSYLHLRRQPHLSPPQAARKKLIFQAPQILVKKLPMRYLTTECT